MGDFNLDARQEVRLENDRLIAWVRPAQGGHSLRARRAGSTPNVLATLDRRPRPTTPPPRSRPARRQPSRSRIRMPERTVDPVILKGARARPRDSSTTAIPARRLVDHFYPVDVTLDDLIACREPELGDFAVGTYLAKIPARCPTASALVMERPGSARRPSDPHQEDDRACSPASPACSVHYELDDLPPELCLHFAVEINLAAMAGHVPDRYYPDSSGTRLGLLDARLDLAHTRGVTLTDEWLDLSVSLSWSQSAGLWCFPIETVSQSEGGIEGVYQSSAVLPHWHVTAGRPMAAGTCGFAGCSTARPAMPSSSATPSASWPASLPRKPHSPTMLNVLTVSSCKLHHS